MKYIKKPEYGLSIYNIYLFATNVFGLMAHS